MLYYACKLQSVATFIYHFSFHIFVVLVYGCPNFLLAWDALNKEKLFGASYIVLKVKPPTYFHDTTDTKITVTPLNRKKISVIKQFFNYH